MSKNRYYTAIVPALLALQAFLLSFEMQCITFADGNILFDWFTSDNLYYLIYNLILYYILSLACLCVWKKFLPGYVLLGILSGIFAVINNMKWNALKECITISDFSKLSEAFKVAGEAEFLTSYVTWVGVVVSVFAVFVWIYADWHFGKKIKEEKHYQKVLVIILLILCIGVIPFLVMDKGKSQVEKLTEAGTADKTGPLVYFVESILTAGEEKEYTVQEALDSYEKYVEQGKRIVAEQETETIENADIQQMEEIKKKGASTVTPNIIVIMSEAFYDVNRFEGVVSYSENPMAAFEEVKKESISGNTMVNVYGGSTHFSEFEFLTGWNTRGMNSGSCPYKEFFSEKQPSFTGYLKEQGYSTIAIHPYDGRFWNRYVAYPRMGFDKFIDRSQMKYTDMCGYISDDSLTNEIIYRYEKRREEKPFFCFGVSIANHIAIINGEKKVNAPDEIEITYHKNTGFSDGKKNWIKQYVSGLTKSGEALKKLTDYFEKQKEPTVIVFFGDHAPSYALDMLKSGNMDETLAYSTPYIIWSNYDLGKDTEEDSGNTDVTASFLSTYLLQKIQMPLPEQSYYNIALQSEYPVETRYIIKNSGGKYYGEFTGEEQQQYYEHALDLKAHTKILLENPKAIQNIWNAGE